MESVSLAERGRKFIAVGAPRTLRKQFGFSRTAQAHMIGVSPTALRDWEDGVSLSRVSAERIAHWCKQVIEFSTEADEQLLKQVEEGTLVHVTVASQRLAMSYGTIQEKCRTGSLRCSSLGPLGLYIHRNEL